MTSRRDTIKLFSAAAAGLALGGINPFNARQVMANTEPVKGRFQVVGDHFELDGKPFQVMAGEMHYPRIPKALWRDRMRKLKSMGLNTLSSYVFWNAHEAQRGRYDFSGDLDLAAFIRTAQEEGLWVCLRPGPYVCAEWDNGGFPTWLFPDDSVAARSTQPAYLQPVKRWFKRLAEEIRPLMISQGGPIILTQIENEYGSYGSDQAHMQSIYQALLDSGLDGVFYTADGAAVMQGGILDGVPAAMNFGTYDKAEAEFAKYREHRPEGPMMCGELWAGWFDHFGKTRVNMPAAPLLKSLEWMLKNKCSFSIYMFHGGTSFGFNAGANFQADSNYAPHVASYDYDAVLDEAGRPSEKFFAVRQLMQNYLPATRFPPLPAAEPFIQLPRFRLEQRAPLSQLMEKAAQFAQPQTLEALGKSHGLMLYRHKAKASFRGELSFGDVRDYALVSVGGRHQGSLDRRFAETKLPVSFKRRQNVDVLVDVMGRVNYGPWIGKDQKGLIGPVKAGEKVLEQWQHLALPLDQLDNLKFSTQAFDGPGFYRGEFELEKSGYTFLDMRGWGKGYVWVNGFNLGRYWSLGPQGALFVPASLLKLGRNQVIVLDLYSVGERSLSSSEKQIWDEAITHARS